MLQKSKQRREEVKSVLRHTEQLGRFAAISKEHRQQVRTKVEHMLSIIQRIYGIASGFHLATFLHCDGPDSRPTYATFPRLLVYFLSQIALPNITQSQAGITPVFDVIPNSSHYHKLSLILHPDKNSPYSEYQSLLNASFDLWSPHLDNELLKAATAPPLDEQGAEDYAGEGSEFEAVSEMYFSYLAAFNEGLSFMNPTSLSPNGLYETLLDAEAAGKLVQASFNDEETGMQNLENGIDEAIEEAKRAAGLIRSRRRKDDIEEIDEDNEEQMGRRQLKAIRRKRRRRNETPESETSVGSITVLDPSLRARTLRSSHR
jgi:hypothetical protein